jgi:hypothetical protein
LEALGCSLPHQRRESPVWRSACLNCADERITQRWDIAQLRDSFLDEPRDLSVRGIAPDPPYQHPRNGDRHPERGKDDERLHAL